MVVGKVRQSTRAPKIVILKKVVQRAPSPSSSSSSSDSEDERPVVRARRFQFQSFRVSEKVETWAEYRRRLKQALAHQGFTSDIECKQAFLTCADPELYRLIVSLCYPEVLESITVSFKKIIGLLDEHLEEEVSEAMAEFLFEARKQKPGESAAEWIADLRRLAIPCNFTDLDRRLRAQLIRGVADEECQKKMLAALTLDVKSALKIIKVHTRAQVECAALNKRPNNEPEAREPSVMYVQNNNNSSASDCFRCGRGHNPDTCWAKDAECRGCGRKGHLLRKCRSSWKKGSGQGSGQGGAGKAPPVGTGPARVNMLRQEQTTGTGEAPGVRPSQGSARTGGGYGPPRAAETAAAGAWSNGAPWEYMLCQVRGGKRYPGPDLVEVEVDGKGFHVILDNGAPCGMMSLQDFRKNWAESRLKADPDTLSVWSGDKVAGQQYCEVTVRVGQQEKTLPLLVAEGNGPFIMGRLWMDAFGFRVSGPVPVCRPQVLAITSAAEQPRRGEATLAKDTAEAREFECFEPGLGRYRGPKMSICPPEGTRPKYLRARPVPFAKAERVAAELRRLVEIGVLEEIDQSDWATPIVVVSKADGGVRICGDYRSTVNMVLKPEGYPLPTLEQAFAKLAGGQMFSKIDLTMAYNQVEVDESTARLLAINTHLGLFKVKRLWFGVSVAPPRFQKLIDGLLAGIEGVVVLLDDVLVQGRNKAEHDHRLREVLRKLSEAGLRINPGKSLFRAAQVEYLGHAVSAEGIAPLKEKVEALRLAPEPQDKDQVRSFLGKINFYEKFMPRRAELLAPLYQLLPRESKWTWGERQREAFRAAKEILCSEKVLVHYSLDLPLVLSVDASPYGVGAVLSHVVMEGGKEVERPVAYASRTLTSAEKNYAQYDKEGLAVVFGVTRFHQYLLGRTFTVMTDHKPLVGLFGGRTPAVTSPRILRWLMTLSAYSMEVKYRPGSRHGNADALSRLPLPGPTEDPPQPPILYVSYIDTEGKRRPEGPVVTVEMMAEATSADPVLRDVRRWAREGWPKKHPVGEEGEFWRKKDQISIIRECVMWGERVCVPGALRQDALARLHYTHQGIVRSKRMARGVLWWPRLDEQIEALVNSCQVCQVNRPADPAPTYKAWPRNRRWGRVHLDFGEPRRGEVFLVAVDAETGWMEAWWVAGPSTASVIRCLREVFSRLGNPDLIVSDNGAAFVSEEMRAFLESRGIKHLTIAAYCAWSNGLAERAVRTVKEGLPRFDGTAGERLQSVLEAARFTPGDDGWSPAQRLMGWQPTVPLDRMRPTLDPEEGEGKGVVAAREKKGNRFQAGEAVWVRKYGRKGTDKWMRARTVTSLGDRIWMCVCANGANVKRHCAQMRRREDGKAPWRKPVGQLSSSEEEEAAPTPRPWQLPLCPWEQREAARRQEARAAKEDDGKTKKARMSMEEMEAAVKAIKVAAEKREKEGEEFKKRMAQLAEKEEEAERGAEIVKKIKSVIEQAIPSQVVPTPSEAVLDLETSDLDEDQLLRSSDGESDGGAMAEGATEGDCGGAANSAPKETTGGPGSSDQARGSAGKSLGAIPKTPREPIRWADYPVPVPSPSPRRGNALENDARRLKTASAQGSPTASPRTRDAREILSARRRQDVVARPRGPVGRPPGPRPAERSQAEVAAARAKKTKGRRERRKTLKRKVLEEGLEYIPSPSTQRRMARRAAEKAGEQPPPSCKPSVFERLGRESSDSEEEGEGAPGARGGRPVRRRLLPAKLRD